MPDPQHHSTNFFDYFVSVIVGIFSSFYYHLPTWEKVEQSIVLACITGTISFFVMGFWRWATKKRRKRDEK